MTRHAPEGTGPGIADDSPGVGADPQDQAPAPTPARKSWLRGLLEWILVLVLAGGLALGLKAWVVEPFHIPSNSMEPTLQVGDRVVVDKAGYRWQDVARGDLVVFEAPAGSGEEGHLVKRVIGLPGEEVSGEAGRVTVDGDLLDEPYTSGVTRNFGPEVVPQETYWVLGDNRAVSLDSTMFGPIDADDIVGRGEAIVWPLDRLQRVGPTNPLVVLAAATGLLVMVTTFPWLWRRMRRRPGRGGKAKGHEAAEIN